MHLVPLGMAGHSTGSDSSSLGLKKTFGVGNVLWCVWVENEQVWVKKGEKECLRKKP